MKTLKKSCIDYVVNDKTGIYAKGTGSDSPLPDELKEDLIEGKSNKEAQQKIVEAEKNIVINTIGSKRGYGSSFL